MRYTEYFVNDEVEDRMDWRLSPLPLQKSIKLVGQKENDRVRHLSNVSETMSFTFIITLFR